MHQSYRKPVFFEPKLCLPSCRNGALIKQLSQHVSQVTCHRELFTLAETAGLSCQLLMPYRALEKGILGIWLPLYAMAGFRFIGATAI